MGKVIDFIVPGDPVPKGRPRFTRSGRTYTPKRTQDYERKVRECFEGSGHEPFPEDVPLRVTIDMDISMPKSWSNKKRIAMQWTPCIKHIDVDNLAKSITDAINGVAFEDDSQIAELLVSKQWSKEGRAFVSIEELEE